MNPASRIVFNTGVLYLKLLIGMAIGLWTTRLVLAALGEVNFGVYSLVAGVVGMLGILQGSMTSASMRFMSYSLGTNDKTTILKTFNTTLFLHFVIGMVIVILIELGGFFMFKYLLNIPLEKIDDARIIFHFMVITTFVSIISVPYDAVMFSNENILALSIVYITVMILKLGIAVFLTFSNGNLLVLYGFLVLLNQIFLRVVKQIYSKIKYDECKIRFRQYVDRKMIKEMLSFSWWNLFGSIAAISVGEVRGVLLNMFFGVRINAAHGISQTASSQVNMVSASMTRALNPQLVKSEGAGNRDRMVYLTEVATKFSVFLFAIFGIPVIIEAKYLLNLWLVKVPEYAVIFCQLILIGLLLDKFTFEITSAIRAVGQIRNFQVAETILILFNIPLGFLILKMGFPPYSVFISGFVIIFLVVFVRLYFGHKIASMDIRQFLSNGVLPILTPIITALIFASLPQFFYDESFLRLLLTTSVSILFMATIFWFLGLTQNEKKKLKVTASYFTKRMNLSKKNGN